MKREEIIEYFVTNRIYPMCSKKGKIFLLKRSSFPLSKEEEQRLILELGLKDHHGCKELREIIRRKLKETKRNRPIKEWIEEERPREMLLKYGADKLPLSKLLAIILRTGSDSISAEELGRALINKFKTLRSLDKASIEELCSISGVGIAKAAQIKAAFELGKRFYKEEAEKMIKIRSPQDVINYVMEYYSPYLRDLNKEVFNVILLDNRNKVIENIEMSKGNLTSSIVDVKDIIREATLKSASSLILVHNHPSGEPDPSKEDINTTNLVIEACKFVGIKVLDHIIIGKNHNDYASFYQLGLIS
jgi:DNA repair protein RadC